MAAEGAVRIPDSHRDLFRRPVCAVLTTLAPDGQPRSCIVWVDEVEGCARFNTTMERAKARDLRRDPRVSLLIVDPDDTSRFVQVRGDAELMTDGAEAQLDELTRRYTAYPCFYGFVSPDEQRRHETRVIGRIRARRVQLDAIHH